MFMVQSFLIAPFFCFRTFFSFRNGTGVVKVSIFVIIVGFCLYFMHKFARFCLILCLWSNTFVSLGYAKTGEKRLFTVTGYYSPLPGQNFYVTGSYEGDIRLNGHGVRGADGTEVFPGMIAAPYTYEFGTKVCLPGFGCGAVHDRGGAIVQKGERNLARHDRLDLWMGYGEEGLSRALELGVWHIEGELFAPGTSDINVGVNFKAATPLSKILDLPTWKNFSDNLSLGDRGALVKELQTALGKLGIYNDLEVGGIYNDSVRLAVLDFQLAYLVIPNRTSGGAGIFGPQTRKALSQALYDFDLQEQMLEKWGKFRFEETLSKGKRDLAVWKLQEILIQHEYLDHEPTGYFGNITKQALMAFQKESGLINSFQSSGAGTVGPQTRSYLNGLFEIEQNLFSLDIESLRSFNGGRDRLRFLAGETENIATQLIVKK